MNLFKILAILPFIISVLIVIIFAMLVILKPVEFLKWLQRGVITISGFKSKRYSSKNGKVVYFEGGKGEKIVLIHGFMVHAGNWSSIAPKLKKRYHVIIPDLPGHGDSPWIYPISLESIGEAMKDFLLEISKEEQVTLVGSSMGGGIAFRFALDYPERVKNLIVINSAGIEWKIRKPLLLPENRAEVQYKLRSIVGPTFKAPNFFLDAMLQQNRPEIKALFEEAVGNPKYYLDEELKNLKPKAHLLWGVHDGLFPMAFANKLTEMIPDYKLTTFPKSAHVPHNTEPKAVIKYILNIVK
jgi:abhydrolase domain-containing protein 6